MGKRWLTSAMVLVLAAGGVAFAFDCENKSRPAPEGVAPGTFVMVGNWAYANAYLPPFPGAQLVTGWIFLVPENFQNGSGYALLANSLCKNETAVQKRQTDRGIQLQSGCMPHP